MLLLAQYPFERAKNRIFVRRLQAKTTLNYETKIEIRKKHKDKPKCIWKISFRKTYFVFFTVIIVVRMLCVCSFLFFYITVLL